MYIKIYVYWCGGALSSRMWSVFVCRRYKCANCATPLWVVVLKLRRISVAYVDHTWLILCMDTALKLGFRLRRTCSCFRSQILFYFVDCAGAFLIYFSLVFGSLIQFEVFEFIFFYILFYWLYRSTKYTIDMLRHR